MTQKTYEFDNVEIMQKKLEILLAGKLRKRNAIKDAVQKQDSISEKSGSWNGAEEIKKWRKKR